MAAHPNHQTVMKKSSLLLITLSLSTFVSYGQTVDRGALKTYSEEPLGVKDAFSRTRVSNPTGLSDHQFTYDLAPLLFDTIQGLNTAIAHDATNRLARMTMAATPVSNTVAMQTFEYFKYQAGKSQLVFVTFNMNGANSNALKFAGYSDGNNGIELRLNNGVAQVAILSDTDSGDEIVAQSGWSLDRMDGTGASGIKLDWTKTHIFVIDFQALYVGRVRVGFDVGGEIIYAHEFNHANILASPYIQTATLPIRVGMTSLATITDTLEFICSSVISEGGTDEASSYLFSYSGTGTAGNGVNAHIISIQPDTLFNGIVNRERIVVDEVSILVTGNSAVKYTLCIGQELTSITATDVNSTYSGVDYVAGTLSGTPAITIDQGFVPATASSKGSVQDPLSIKYPISLGADGLPRALGRVTLLAQGIGASSGIQYVIKWREIR